MAESPPQQWEGEWGRTFLEAKQAMTTGTSLIRFIATEESQTL